MKFNLDEYESVEARIRRFYTDHPAGCIYSNLESSADNIDFSVFSAEVWVDGVKRATGWSVEQRDKELSKSKSGYEYESVNYTSWLENCETSAIGRALANFNYSGSKRPSKEEMQKVDRGNPKTQKARNDERQKMIDEIAKEIKKYNFHENDLSFYRAQVKSAPTHKLLDLLEEIQKAGASLPPDDHADEITGTVEDDPEWKPEENKQQDLPIEGDKVVIGKEPDKEIF